MSEPPEYTGIFQYIVENFEDPGKSSPEEKFWVKDLEENQYKRLKGPVNPRRTEFSSPEEAALQIRVFAEAAGVDIIGFTSVYPSMVFKGADIKERYCIVLGYEMDHKAIDTAPEDPAGKEALRAYWRLGDMVMKVAEFVRYLGYPATGHQVRTFLKDPPTILNTVAGYHAGLGDVGMLGLLITPEFGPRVRLGTITTDLPFPQGKKIDIGLQEFCQRCKICAIECMGDAIATTKKDERGHFKYTIDPKKCVPPFAKYDGCGVCIKVCPFNRTREGMKVFLPAVKRLNEHHRNLPSKE